MNDRIAKTGLKLCVIYLFAFYILKFFFPQILVQTIASPTLIRLGEVIGTWIGFEYLVRLLASFITFYLFACASCGNFKLHKWQFEAIVIGAVANNLVFDFAASLYTHTSISIMLLLALACKGKMGYTVISFVLHGYLSLFLLSIRGFETVILYLNPVSGLLMNLEVDVWLVLLGIIHNIKEKKLWEFMHPPTSTNTPTDSPRM